MKNIYLKCLFLGIFALSSIHAAAYECEVGGIYYNLYGMFAEVTYLNDGYDNESAYSGSVTIPSSIIYNGKSYNVTRIGYQAFEYCSGLTSVTIPESVTIIRYQAFCDCSSLTSVTIPESVTSIESSAFDGCSSLTSVTIPESVTCIESRAFSGCSSLTSVTIPESVTSIESSAFSGCSGLTSVTIPNSVTSIEMGVFEDCSGLTSIEIPNSVTSIGNSAFANCNSLSTINFPEGLKTIDNDAFYRCEKLKVIHLPASLEYLGVSIDEDDFVVDEDIINKNPFSYCTSLETVMIDQANPFFNSRNKCNAIIETSTNRLLLGCVNTKIPNGVQSIGDNAFCGCYGLTAISSDMQSDALIIPSTVKIIGESAFRDCLNIKSVELPEGIEEIGDKAFSYTFSLESLSLPSTITHIGNGAFGNTFWDWFEIDDEEGAHDLIKLRSVTSHAKIPFGIDYGTFCYYFIYHFKESSDGYTGRKIQYSDVYIYATLYVPKGTAEEYKKTNAWSSFRNIVEIGENDISSINGVDADNNSHLQKEVYSVEGRKQRQLSHGLNIVRMMDGSVKKVFIK